MIEIKITPNSPEMMAKVIALLTDLNGAVTIADTEQKSAPKSAKAAQKSAPKSVEPPAETPLPEIVISEPAAELPEVTLEQVRAALAALSALGKTALVKELLANYGASKLTDIPADKYGELLAAAEGL